MLWSTTYSVRLLLRSYLFLSVTCLLVTPISHCDRNHAAANALNIVKYFRSFTTVYISDHTTHDLTLVSILRSTAQVLIVFFIIVIVGPVQFFHTHTHTLACSWTISALSSMTYPGETYIALPPCDTDEYNFNIHTYISITPCSYALSPQYHLARHTRTTSTHTITDSLH